MNKFTKNLLELLVIVTLFISVSYFIQTHLAFFEDAIKNYRYLGAFSYIILAILVTVFAPLTAIPLIPLVSSLYGWFFAGLFSFIGWFIGSIFIFYICRNWGKKVARKLISFEKLEKWESKISREKKLWSLIFLRMSIPADVLSYALGLFTNVGWKTYIIVSFVGLIPFAFVIAYLGELSFIYQIIGALIILIVFLIALIYEALRKD